MRLLRSKRAVAFAFALVFQANVLVCGRDEPPDTIAERSDFRGTARHQDVLEFLDQLAERSPHARRLAIGTTVEGRELAGLVVARPAVASAAEVHKSGKLLVLLIGNIHAGECDGKEALLALARELALNP